MSSEGAALAIIMRLGCRRDRGAVARYELSDGDLPGLVPETIELPGLVGLRAWDDRDATDGRRFHAAGGDSGSGDNCRCKLLVVSRLREA